MVHEALEIVAGSTYESTGLLVLTSDLRDHLRVDTTDEDDLIAGLAVAARRRLESRTRRSFLTQECRLWRDAFPDESSTPMRLPRAPLQRVLSITGHDSTGGSTSVSSDDWIEDAASEPGRVALSSTGDWPSDLRSINGAEVDFLAGYGDESSDVPEPLVLATKLLTAHYYENRQEVIVSDRRGSALPLPSGVEFLIEDYLLDEEG